MCVRTIFYTLLTIISLPTNALACGDDALNTFRLLPVSSDLGPVGTINYRQTLPLRDKEVVLTFDDGPMPVRTEKVLKALSEECVKATFFMVGSMVAAYPKVARMVAEEGHTIGNHTWSHRYLNRSRNASQQDGEIAGGLLAIDAITRDHPGSMSSFFRFPGLGRTRQLERLLSELDAIPMSADVVGDDWHRISSDQVLERTMRRLRERGRGIILLHDIHNRTVAMVPELLRSLKREGFKVVHLLPDRQEAEYAVAHAPEVSSRRIQVALGKLTQPEAAPAPRKPLEIQISALRGALD